MDLLELDIELDREAFRLAVRESFDLSGITAVFGANGSGKTSLLRVIAGLEPAARGRVTCRGEQWLGPKARLEAEARRIGYVFQDGRLFPHLDVRGNLEFPRRHGGRTGPIDLDETVETFDLHELLHRYPGALSGGERQRVAVARALLANPGLLLMDEPLSSLDRSRKHELLPLIRSLPRRYGMPIIYVTHDIDELVYLADTVVLLAGGKVVARGSAREILERGDFELLAGLEEPGLVLEARIANHSGGLTIASLPSGELRIPRMAGQPGDIVRLRVHPRDVILAAEPVARISIRNCLAATVRKLEPSRGDQVLVSLAVGDQLLKARVTADAARELELGEGRPVYALIKTVALEAFG
ncbi:MAG TPA: molybdenum ABC transporter ATP-binding protein [Gammaproteobacteria bacterium]|nr:molybdenum ABC transporter ATP-binding protein [Gammaproteobacteria bacterium]